MPGAAPVVNPNDVGKDPLSGPVLSSAGTKSVGQLEALATTAGFTGDDVQIAAAIALSESGGDPTAVNPVSHATGLWQILPSNFAQSGLTAATAKDPQANANAAYKIFKQIGWAKGWTTYNTASFKSNLAIVQNKGVSIPGVSSIESAINAAVSTAEKIGLDFVTISIVITLLVLGFIIVLRKPIGKISSRVKVVPL